MDNFKHMMAQRVALILNQMLERDPEGLASLLSNRVPTTPAVFEHPTIMTLDTEQGPVVGLMGLLTGIIGLGDDGQPLLHMLVERSDQKTIIGFRVKGEPTVDQTRDLSEQLNKKVREDLDQSNIQAAMAQIDAHPLAASVLLERDDDPPAICTTNTETEFQQTLTNVGRAIVEGREKD